ncbi:glutathione hydrolase 1 proenzyme-like [Ptychodera flava]|uniref:glutathione hydrolase 1 proenzyme-like n=1 Tax=Ptychodera flava TaxID=63121 RepID=UPI00396A7041
MTAICATLKCARDFVNVDSHNSPCINPSLTAEGFVFTHAVVVADHKTCSQVGKAILQQGGNAVDAAIAAMLCTGVVNTHSVGVGGGHFMVVYNKEKGVIDAIDARVAAPASVLERNFSVGNSYCSPSNGLCIAVPGEISGYWLAHQRYGKLPWVDLFQPAIRLASEGITIGSALKNAIEKKKDKIAQLQPLKNLLINESGEVYRARHRMVRPKYAQTLRRIATGGIDSFYRGQLAEDVVADIQEAGGTINLDDLHNYRAKLSRPLKTKLGPFDMFTTPPPSGGAALMFIINIMKGK